MKTKEKELRKADYFVPYFRIFIVTSIVIGLIYLFVLSVVSNYYIAALDVPGDFRQYGQLGVLIFGCGGLFVSFGVFIFNMVFGIKCIAIKRVSFSSFFIFLIQSVLIWCFIFLLFRVSLVI